MTPPSKAEQDIFSRRFSELFSDLNTTVRSIVPDREAVNEILQNTATVLWEKYWNIDDPSEFRKVAFTIVRYQILSYRRDRARNRLLFDEGIVSLIVDPGTTLDTAFSRERELLDQGLSSLTKEERELILAAYQPGVKITRLAEQQGKTAMSLYKKIQKIRATLLKNVRSEQKKQSTES